jgi:hypothetical protein
MLFSRLAWGILLTLPGLPPGNGGAATRCVLHHAWKLLSALEIMRLKGLVASAVLQGPAPETIECMVGQAATINSIREGIGPLAVSNFEIHGVKPADHTLKWLRNSAQIVYWTGPLVGRGVDMVGVRWTKDGRVQMFTGIICLP